MEVSLKRWQIVKTEFNNLKNKANKDFKKGIIPLEKKSEDLKQDVTSLK